MSAIEHLSETLEELVFSNLKGLPIAVDLEAEESSIFECEGTSSLATLTKLRKLEVSASCLFGKDADGEDRLKNFTPEQLKAFSYTLSQQFRHP